MKRIKVYLKSGQTVEFEAESFVVERNGFGQIAKVEWKDGEGLALECIDVDQIAAVTSEKVGVGEENEQ